LANPGSAGEITRVVDQNSSPSKKLECYETAYVPLVVWMPSFTLAKKAFVPLPRKTFFQKECQKEWS
jgi:hypothetical protein